METKVSSHGPVIIKKKYGITERKKAELDALTTQVMDAQFEVNQYQSIVTALTSKAANFQGFLTTADNTRVQTLGNKTLVGQLLQSALELQGDANTAFAEMLTAEAKTNELGNNIKQVIDKLIYTAEILDKLSGIITRKKVLNPLISDELISLIATAGKDANSAVALTLVGLKSTFAAQASNIESEAAVLLAFTQAEGLYTALTEKDTTDGTDTEPLKKLLYKAYSKANENYIQIESALAIVTNQLNVASFELNKAQVKLKSLQAGLAAATAAALAS